MKRTKRFNKYSVSAIFLIFSAILLICLGRELHQARLGQQLIVSLKQRDNITSMDLIRNGADPNACDNPTKQSLWGMLTHLINQKGTDTVAKTPALLVALAPRGIITMSGGYYHAKQYIQGIAIFQNDQNDKDGITKYDPSHVVSALLQRGADINVRDARGNTALHYAVAFGYEKCVQILLDYHADVNSRNKEGFTPLMYAVPLRNLKIAEMLLQHGGRVNDTVTIAIPGGNSSTKVTAGQMNFHYEKMKPLLKKYGAIEVY